MNARNLVSIAVLGLAALTSHAQTGLPGLWEVTQKMGGNPEIEKAMATMQKQMANMPAAERKQMEAMMGSSGMGMQGAAGGGVVVKTCVTKEMAERSQIPMQQGNCTSTVLEKTGATTKMKFSCINPPSSGEGQFSFISDKAYTMKMKIDTVAQGQPQTMTMEGAGKWLSADCGSIKPIEIPKK